MSRVGTVRRADLADGELLALLRTGDDEAFAELVGRHRAIAFSVARRMLPGDAASAEDAVEDAIAATLRAVRNGHGPDSDFRPYFLAATKTAAFEVTRRRLSPGSPDHALATDGSEFSLAESGHELTVLNECFHRLRPAWRHVLWQVHVDGVPPPAVADELGVSRRAVDAACQRARRHLARDYVAHLLPTQCGTAACASLQHRLADYGLGLADVDDGALLESHLGQCQPCRERVDAVRRIPEQLPAITPPVAIGMWKLLASLLVGNGAAGVGAIGLACLVAVTPVLPSDQAVADARPSVVVRADLAPSAPSVVHVDRAPSAPAETVADWFGPPAPGADEAASLVDSVSDSVLAVGVPVTSPLDAVGATVGSAATSLEAAVATDLAADHALVGVDLAVIVPGTTIAIVADVQIELLPDPTVPALDLIVPLPALLTSSLPPQLSSLLPSRLTTPTITWPAITRPIGIRTEV
jgi:RNA polymerase sigma-70 factor (ECF subfamily)